MTAAESAADASAARPTLTARGAQTRARILETALRLFRERGYEETTMRGIAAEAGVSLGNAYYYFRSKEHLIQAFYARTHAEHLDVVRPRLEGVAAFEDRLALVLRTKIETSEPYHRFSGVLFRTAADPESPLNPFSADSEPIRREATELMGLVLDGSGLRVPADLAAELPDLLWTYQMGVVLFWIHDRSPQRRRTYRLIERTVPLVSRILRLGSLPGLRSLSRRAVAFVRELREERDDP